VTCGVERKKSSDRRKRSLMDEKVGYINNKKNKKTLKIKRRRDKEKKRKTKFWP